MIDETKKTIRVHIQDSGEYKYSSTKITDVETGKIIDNITEATVTMVAGDVTQATLTVFNPVVDIIVDAELRKICPVCGRDVEDEHE